MDWVERRFVFQQTLKSAWLDLQTEIETAVRSFDERYTNPHQSEIQISDRTPWCITIQYAPIATGIRRSIQICLDDKGKRVFSRIDGAETDVLYLGFDTAGNAHVVDRESAVIGNDRASQILLEPFLFPDSQATPQHVRFPMATKLKW